jgi:peptide/nickel transport system permease protein
MTKETSTVAVNDSSLISAAVNQNRTGEFHRFVSVFFSRGLVRFGTVIILLFIITAIFGPWMSPYDPYAQDLNNVLLQPSQAHLLGTDAVGRDTLSRLIYGSRTAIMVGVIALAIAAAIGMMLGLAAGYFGGWVNTLIMRFIDALMSFPPLLLALVIAALLGGGLKNVMIALGIGMMPGYARIMCGQVLSIKENDYIISERSVGAGSWRIMLRHVMPNCLPPIIVQISMMVGMTILAEAGLSFLGIGIEPPGAAWGAMVNDGYYYLLTRPVLSFAPGLAIVIVVFAFNMVGDGLRDALDPRLRGIL